MRIGVSVGAGDAAMPDAGVTIRKVATTESSKYVVNAERGWRGDMTS
jgi:hypothetical protein